MSTIVLIGFSCSGKSTFRKSFKKWMRNHSIERAIEFVDTDDEIAQEEDAIYKIFINKVKRNGDRSDAMTYIKDQEKEFLKNFTPQKDCLIAAGPLLPLHAEWNDFVARTEAKCVWLLTAV